MEINTQGLIEGIPYTASPNCDDRPPAAEIEVLIVHAISLPPGEFGGPDVERLFSNTLDCDSHPFYSGLKGRQVSAHLFIRRDGSMMQFVPFAKRAWHAGESEIEGRNRVNDFSIGIELEGADDDPFEEAQYQALAAVSRLLVAQYELMDFSRIYGHSQIAPNRKTDPGSHFDWPRYLSMCRA
ncbi:MAG TPA: 1,6-anhydro-N-acetylmuramyl-L-alanine amidase AmpD [Acidiferrobacteraceae bacterium]|nr:1,6-anhydro-N-acetylmuramyl-L-alanine amidase AmpD [Acidiferrobacteraceae bacterium]HEX19567.1 1,6-anhydro-N-acetylmuramyl-L-alanine amidase AmpD [Acidiferrobacteraceae bacterium]